MNIYFFFFSSRRRHTRYWRDWSSDVCSSDLVHEEKLEAVRGSMWMSKEDWKRSWKPWLRGTAFGFPIGALPAGGSAIPTFLSYLTEKKLAKNPEEFGQGAIEDVAGAAAPHHADPPGPTAPLS